MGKICVFLSTNFPLPLLRQRYYYDLPSRKHHHTDDNSLVKVKLAGSVLISQKRMNINRNWNLQCQQVTAHVLQRQRHQVRQAVQKAQKKRPLDFSNDKFQNLAQRKKPRDALLTIQWLTKTQFDSLIPLSFFLYIPLLINYD